MLERAQVQLSHITGKKDAYLISPVEDYGALQKKQPSKNEKCNQSSICVFFGIALIVLLWRIRLPREALPTNISTEAPRSPYFVTPMQNDTMHIAIMCTEAHQHRAAHGAITNIVSVSSFPLIFHLLSADNNGLPPLEQSPLTGWKMRPFVKVYDLDRGLPAEVQQLEQEMAAHTVGRGKKLMYKVLLHRILPAEISRVLLWDVDVFVLSDVRQLWDMFGTFKPGQLAAMAYEQQATYYNWWPEEGNRYFRGYNDGIQLLDLVAMRQSTIFNNIVAAHHYGDWLPDKTSRFSSGGLGDQDFYALLGHQHPELIGSIPCGWNRQLCQYWHQRLPQVRVDDCPWSTVRVIHGNCYDPWQSPCSPDCAEGRSAAEVVKMLLHEPCGSALAIASLQRLNLVIPTFNCSLT